MQGAFAGRPDAWIITEGVERIEELDVPAALGVPLVQGYLLGRPGRPWVELDPGIAHRLARRVPDDAGCFTGLVRVERLITALTGAAGEVPAVAVAERSSRGTVSHPRRGVDR